MKHSLRFESIVQPCDLSEEASKLVKKTTYEGLAPSSTSKGQAKPKHHPFPPPKKVPFFLALDRRAQDLSEVDNSPSTHMDIGSCFRGEGL
jgi:hypothetical protein